MTNAQPSGVVVDTMVISWLFDDRANPLADRYRVLIGPRRVLLAFHTVMELRYGALRAGWGDLRRRRLERHIAELTVVQPDDKMITACANLRVRCKQIGGFAAPARKPMLHLPAHWPRQAQWKALWDNVIGYPTAQPRAA